MAVSLGWQRQQSMTCIEISEQFGQRFLLRSKLTPFPQGVKVNVFLFLAFQKPKRCTAHPSSTLMSGIDFFL
ncbi:MAG: hypothetical protein COA99_06510 [Moraxellaceae bacterium]|nr:MAG: hypothetical protein COA99_06510 [Moraxellaceae bacterium]